MKKFLIIMALTLPVAARAQTGVVAVHPENNEGRMMTMEEAVMGMGTRPQTIMASWADENTYILMEGRSMKAYNAATGQEVEFNGAGPQGPQGPRRMTRGAIPNKNGVTAYTKGQSLYINNNGTEIAVAVNENDQITYGQAVSRNEFGINGGIFWSPSGDKLAFYRKDESRVTDFPLLDISTRTGTLKSIKYPMNGMESEEVSLGVYDLASGKTVWCDVTDFGYDRYLTNISWSPDDRYLFIQVLDRSQKHVRLNMYRSCDGSFVRTLLEDEDPRYVEPSDPLHFIKDTYVFLYRTEVRDGYRNLYLCDTLGTVRRLTEVDADVQYLDNDGTNIYYTSAEVSPVENHLFKIQVTGLKPRKGPANIAKAKIGKSVRLTAEEGWHSVSLSPGYKYFIDRYSSFNVPSVTCVKSLDGKMTRELGRAENPLKAFKTGKIMLGTVKSADGQYDNWYRLYLPAGFDPSKKYPVLLYVYGGPHSQLVNDSWLGSVRMWELLMAQKGYVVYVQDNRGTPNRGAEYEKVIHRHCGQAEMADQMVGINMLKSLPFVDSERIGVHGWSYGGFMTISLMTSYPETFKVGVAGGPVIDWKWYEIMYGERYMDTPETNPEGFKETSLIENAANLKGKLLICQGAVDNTVVWEHSLSFVQKCIENGTQMDYFPYPLSEHNVAGRWRIHLMDKVTDYFDLFL
ncbi:MAG: DPP IV N-terminal domain-containing protein [Bacteroidales bacterium]|nr:DPP IV N-terminal domain-containing protein [Bacteroidales bacterium]